MAEKFEGFKLQQQCVSEDESFSWISCSNLGQIMLGWTTLCILCVTTCVDSVLHDQILFQSLIKLCRQNHQVVAHVCKCWYFNGSSPSIVLVPMSWRRWMNQVFFLVIDRSAIITTFCTLLSSIWTVGYSRVFTDLITVTWLSWYNPLFSTLETWEHLVMNDCWSTQLSCWLLLTGKTVICTLQTNSRRAEKWFLQILSVPRNEGRSVAYYHHHS